MNNIFDSHSHYADHAFDEDRYELLDILPEKGVRYAMLASSDLRDTEENAILAEKYSYLYAAAGIHPEYAGDMPENWLDVIREKAVNCRRVKAIGECGLDRHYEDYSAEAQEKVFTAQLELARELDMPVIVHTRDAWEDTMRLLKKYRPRGVVHCFSGSAEIAAEVLKLGMYIGLTGVITFSNAKKAVRALETVPADRLLLETDCPYMAPVPLRGKRCDSSMIRYTAEKAAEIKNIPVQELLDITCRNALELYGIEEEV